MRGCLSVLVLAAIVVALAGWVVAPLVAERIVMSALVSQGFDGSAPTVAIASDPPPLLLLGHADRVRVTSGNDSIRGMRVDRLDVTLADVGLIDRSFRTIDATLTGVSFPQPDGSAASIARIDMNGPGGSATTVASLDLEQVRALVADAIGEAAASGLSLAPPDRVVYRLGPASVSARLAVGGDGALVLVPDLGPIGPVEIFRPAASTSLELTGVSVTGDGMELTGRIDAVALLR